MNFQQLIKTIPAQSLNCMSVCFDKFSTLLKQPIAIEYSDDAPKNSTAVVLLSADDDFSLKVLTQLLSNYFKPAINTYLIIARATSLIKITEPHQLSRIRHSTSQLSYQSNCIVEYIRTLRPDFVLNIQGSQYSGPPFALASQYNPISTAVCSYFTQWLIHVDATKGLTMETYVAFPILTVEAGGCEDEKSDETMYNGLKRLLSSPTPFQQQQSVDILHNPARLRLAPDASVAFADRPVFGSDVSLSTDIETLNFGKTNETSLLGWTDCHEMNHFNLQGGTENATIDEYFIIKNGEIRPRAGLKIFMATPRLDIARDDCLLYFIDLNKQLTHIPQGIAEQDTNLATVR